MKKRKRETNIFSMSALDLFASALGAFVLITIILFPFYQKAEPLEEKIDKLEKQLEQSAKRVQKAQSDLEKQKERNKELQQEKEELEKKLSKTFLAVVIKWQGESRDIDLHVTDPNGNEFYYKKNNRDGRDFPDSSAKLSTDDRNGPGMEIWEQPEAPQGEYTIKYDYYDEGDNPGLSTVNGDIYYRGGKKELEKVTLRSPEDEQVIAIVDVDEQGDVEIRNP